jgi:DNA-directed RNA polymerase specialized sigma24 family protein
LREVYALHSLSGLSLGEVAAALGLTVSATKMRLFRARDRLRTRLKPVWVNTRPRGAAARSRALAN